MEGVGAATSGRGLGITASAAGAGRDADGGAAAGWLGAAGAEGRIGRANGASDALAGLGGAAPGCLGTSAPGPLCGLAVVGAGAGALTLGAAGATLAVTGGTFAAIGGTPRAGVPDDCAVGNEAGGALDPAGGVGRRPGTNGGTRAGVALRGAPLDGVMRGPGSATTGGGPAVGLDTVGALTDATWRVADVRLAASWGVAKSSVQLRAAVIGMIPPHTEQRARTPGPGTRAGSTRNTVWHSGQETFMTRRLG